MPIETVNFTISGSNPRTGSLQINTTGAGAGNGTIVDLGSVAGVDSIQAAITSRGMTSNAVNVIWQATNGPIAVTPVTVYATANSYNAQFPAGLTSGTFGGPVATNISGLMFNTHPNTLFPGDPHDSGNQADPFVNNVMNSSGGYAGDQAIFSGSFLMCLTGSFVVAAAGQITLTAVLNSTCIIAIPGASYVSGRQGFNGMTTTPIMGYNPLVGDAGLSWLGGNNQTDNFVVNFPEKGVYPFEICFATGPAGERQFDLLYNNTELILPVASTTVPPAPAVGTGNVILTPTSQGPFITGSEALISVQIQGINYTTIPYLGLLEGTPGVLYITNSTTGGTNFTLPTFNGQTPGGAAETSAFTLTGNNGSWSNKLSVTNPGGGFVTLGYNGAPSDANVASTEITLTQDDVSWYSPSIGIDLFQATSQGGGQSFSIQVLWLVNANVTVSPLSVQGNGEAVNFTISLVKPLPPIQNNTSAQMAFDAAFGSVTVVASPVLNSAGWITAFTATATPVSTSSAKTSNVQVTVFGQCTYLVGTSFTTATVNYFQQTISIAVAAQTGGPIISMPSLTSSDTYTTLAEPSAYVTISGNGTGATASVQLRNNGVALHPSWVVLGTTMTNPGNNYTFATETLFVNGSPVASSSCTCV
jgi:hypothetical protein